LYYYIFVSTRLKIFNLTYMTGINTKIDKSPYIIRNNCRIQKNNLILRETIIYFKDPFITTQKYWQLKL